MLHLCSFSTLIPSGSEMRWRSSISLACNRQLTSPGSFIWRDTEKLVKVGVQLV